MRIATVIMAGGSGKRFWPLSRENRAKQSLPLFSSQTLLAETIERVRPLTGNIVVVSSAKQRKYIDADIAQYPGAKAIYEPLGRNTAPCIALAARFIEKEWGADTVVVVLPADHYISMTDAFRTTLEKAIAYLVENRTSIGTIGIAPTRPDTGFGYIRKGSALTGDVFGVERFEEKPDLARATSFLESGRYLWNGGIFIFSAAHILEEFKALNSDILEGVDAIADFRHITSAEYGAIRSISVDYAIMEKTKSQIFTVPGDFGWSDIGNWQSYYELLPKDEKGNAARGPVHFVDCNGCLAVNLTDKPLFLLKKEGALLVAAEDALLEADLTNHQDVRKVTEYIEQKGLLELI